jgi:hypothetical protein
LNSSGHIQGFRQRIGGAVAEIEPRFGIDALAVPIEGDCRPVHLRFVERDNLHLDILDEPP